MEKFLKSYWVKYVLSMKIMTEFAVFGPKHLAIQQMIIMKIRNQISQKKA